MPWPEWGETDFLLTQGYAEYQRRLCPCGCGQFTSDCLDPLTAGLWEVVDERCQARAALAEWSKDNADAPEGTLLRVRLRSTGESAEASALAEIEAMQRRHGLI